MAVATRYEAVATRYEAVATRYSTCSAVATGTHRRLFVQRNTTGFIVLGSETVLCALCEMQHVHGLVEWCMVRLSEVYSISTATGTHRRLFVQ